MGNQQTKRRTKEEAKKFKENRSNIVNFRKEQINNYMEEANMQTIKQIKNSNTTMEESAIALSNLNNTNKLLEISKTQLDREGMGLTKNDLIAIIIALEPNYASKINEINKNTVQDLNTIIRVIIYDPAKYKNTKPNDRPMLDNKSGFSTKKFLQLF